MSILCTCDRAQWNTVFLISVSKPLFFSAVIKEFLKSSLSTTGETMSLYEKDRQFQNYFSLDRKIRWSISNIHLYFVVKGPVIRHILYVIGEFSRCLVERRIFRHFLVHPRKIITRSARSPESPLVTANRTCAPFLNKRLRSP